MKIIMKPAKPPRIQFKDLGIGELYKRLNGVAVYMKINRGVESPKGAVVVGRIDSQDRDVGNIYDTPAGLIVEPLEGEMTLAPKGGGIE